MKRILSVTLSEMLGVLVPQGALAFVVFASVFLITKALSPLPLYLLLVVQILTAASVLVLLLVLGPFGGIRNVVVKLVDRYSQKGSCWARCALWLLTLKNKDGRNLVS